MLRSVHLLLSASISLCASSSWDVRADILVGDWNNHKVLRFDDSGHFLGDFGDASDAVGLGIPGAIAIDRHGTVHVKSLSWGNIYRFDRDGNYLGLFDDHKGRGGQMGMQFDSHGTLWFRRAGSDDTELSGSRLVAMDGNGTIIREINTRLTGIGAFAIDDDDRFYVPRAKRVIPNPPDPLDGIYVFGPGGEPLGAFGEATYPLSGCAYPQSTAFDSSSRLYVYSQPSVILRYESDGQFAGVFAQGNIAGYLMIDPLDNVYIGHGSGDGIMKYSSDGTFLGKIISAGVDGVPINFRHEGIAYVPPVVPEPALLGPVVGLFLVGVRRTAISLSRG
jgi:hypothetical protein